MELLKNLIIAAALVLSTTVSAQTETKVPTIIDRLEMAPERTMVLEGVVTRGTTEPIIRKLVELDLDYDPENPEPAFLVLNTPGGSVVAGLSLINVMEATSIPITCVIDTKAYSMGAIITLYCDKVYIHKFASLMYHEVQYTVSGTDSTIESRVKFLRNSSIAVHEEVAKKLGLTTEEYYAKINKEWWLTAKEAIDAGIADGIVNVMDYKRPGPQRNFFSIVFGELFPDPLELGSTK